MNTKVVLNVLFLALIFSGVQAQNKITESDLKSAVSNIFDLSKNKDYQTAAAKLLYNEKDINRAYNYSEKSEAKAVKRKCKKIKAYLDLSDSYEYDGFTNGTLNDLPSSIVKINFKSGDQELKISFEFVKLQDKILLVDFK